jgi:hypothetical protein
MTFAAFVAGFVLGFAVGAAFLAWASSQVRLPW